MTTKRTARYLTVVAIIAIGLLFTLLSPRHSPRLTTTKLPTIGKIRVSYFARDGESTKAIQLNPDEARRFLELLRHAKRTTPVIGGGTLSFEFRFDRRSITSQALLAGDAVALSFPIYESLFQKLIGEPVYYTIKLDPSLTPRLFAFLEDSLTR
jgi:hypothetical protein